MGSDRARVSYDPRQQYRSVVMQQGRVQLEADWNESQQIFGEEARSEALDIVGPCGTPDDGYKVVPATVPAYPPYDFSVEPGTMYVGGMRVTLPDAVAYSNQPDWQDYSDSDPDWVDPSSFYQQMPLNDFVYLSLREQEISAVEDFDLKDVALGGPDTAQRTRLLQRFVRVAAQGTDCASGLAAAQAHWQTEGLSFDPATMRLTSSSMLSVSAADQQSTQSPCQPQAQGGYVDPDNQLIRVQISGIDPLTGNPKFLWGFDDASFLYRIDVDPNNPENLIFQSVPVDNYHQPVRGQAVEVLRSAAELPNGGVVAALSGFVFTLDQNYNADAQSVVLPSGIELPAEYLTSRQSPALPLFLRVWQEEKVFTPGVATVLGDTGLQVTLEASGGVFHLGDFWMFAARPATPQTVYPERYWNQFQPSDGPRMWACPLGVIAWSDKRTGALVSDCREQFDNLVDLTKRRQGCCTISVRPEDITGTKTLQSVLDQAVNLTMEMTAVDAGPQGNNIRIGITNVQKNAMPATFDFNVTDTATYSGVSLSTIDGILGDETTASVQLAHVVKASITQNLKAVIQSSQVYTFSDSQTPSAQANIFDVTGAIAFTLEAKRPGDDGNLTSVTISNVDSTVTPNTFDITLGWTKSLQGLTLSGLQQSIQNNMSYEITAIVPRTRATSLPLEDVTYLSGGASGNAPAQASAILYGSPVTLCLQPGTYVLSRSLHLTAAHSNVTIEGCGGGVTLIAAPGSGLDFLQGMILVAGANHVTLRGLTFEMPVIRYFNQPQQQQVLTYVARPAFLQLQYEAVSIGIRPVACRALMIEDCIFRYPLMEGAQQAYVGILASGECIGAKIRNNKFVGPPDFATNLALASGVGVLTNLIIGYLHSASVQTIPSFNNLFSASVAGAILDDARIENNTLQNLLIAMWLQVPIGSVSVDSNVIRGCIGGFVMLSLAMVTQAMQAEAGAVNTPVEETLRTTLSQQIIQHGLAFANSYPLPESFKPANTVTVADVKPSAPANKPAGVMTKIENMLSLFRPAQEAAAAPESPQTAKAEGATVLPEKDVHPVTAQLAQVFAAYGSSQSSLVMNLHIANNDMDASMISANSDSFAIEILEEDKGTLGSVTMIGNRLRNLNATSYTTMIYGVSRCVVSGNLILNEAPVPVYAVGTVTQQSQPPQSLVVSPNPVGTVYQGSTAGIAIVGNVMRGQPTLPARNATLPYGLGNLPAPMDRWEAYNTLI